MTARLRAQARPALDAPVWRRVPGASGAWYRPADGARLELATYQPMWIAQRPSGARGAFYTLTAAHAWINAEATGADPFSVPAIETEP
jgi:hypothetical protein